MRTLTAEQRRQWATDGYLHLEGVLDADQVEFLSSEIDRIRTVPGWEPDRRPELPRGHYGWLDHADDLDPSGFMDRRDLLTYNQEFIDLMDRSPVFEYIVDIMGPYNYCQLWVRCYDFDAIPDVLERCTPRQRRLLGDLGYDFRPGSYFYVPNDQVDVIGNTG